MGVAVARRDERYVRTDPEVLRCVSTGKPRFATRSAAECFRNALSPDGQHHYRLCVGACACCLGWHVWILPMRLGDLMPVLSAELASDVGRLLVIGGGL